MRVHAVCLFAVLVLMCTIPRLGGHESYATPGAATSGGSGQVEALILLCGPYGANYNLVRDVMELYGWNITTTGVDSTVGACYYGGPITVDARVSEITDVSPYDCLVIMPSRATVSGGSHIGLLGSTEALDLVSLAAGEGLLVVAFCGGTRVLAAADVIDGVSVTGNPDYQAEYVAAGGIWAGADVPPVLDGNILTTRRGQYYSHRICEIMRTALDSIRAAGPSR
jgi:putative intracellular protease/amidase